MVVRLTVKQVSWLDKVLGQTPRRRRPNGGRESVEWYSPGFGYDLTIWPNGAGVLCRSELAKVVIPKEGQR
jgi:hypothetical protein